MLTQLRYRSRPLVYFLALVFLALFGLADYATGHEVSLSILYLLPIALLSWYEGRCAGVGIAVAAVGVSVAADILAGLSYSHSLIVVWNACSQLLLFLVVVVLLLELRIALLPGGRDPSKVDPLTGVASRSHFYDVARVEVDRAHRYQHSLAVAVLTVDNLGDLRRRFGRVAADALQRLVAEAVSRNIRASDLVARLGDGEFAILLPEIGEAAAQAIASKLEELMGEVGRADGLPVQCSIALALFLSPPGSVEEIVRTAADLMGSARHGGGLVVVQQAGEG